MPELPKGVEAWEPIVRTDAAGRAVRPKMVPANGGKSVLASGPYVATSGIPAIEEAARADERSKVREELRHVLARFEQGLKRGVEREYDKTLDREDRLAGHGEAEAYGRALSLLRAALDQEADRG